MSDFTDRILDNKVKARSYEHVAKYQFSLHRMHDAGRRRRTPQRRCWDLALRRSMAANKKGFEVDTTIQTD